MLREIMSGGSGVGRMKHQKLSKKQEIGFKMRVTLIDMSK